ncbi:HNH endonuclease [Micromonospora inyonensis]|uniref:HNH endonuclease n=1 Tax=Micromonospora inyonensis TaxID=47866 RepID=UPI00159EF736|nr:HNH endonuclease [Micromonospora inyonensis]
MKARRCPLCAVRMTDQPYLPASKELDHIVPLGVGGTHTIGNVRIICRACNLKRPKDGGDYAGPVTLFALEVA